MLKLRKVAITGGLSCGKSSVCRVFEGFGAYVISADKIVHQLLSIDTNLGQEIIQLLGSYIVVNKQIDRSRIAQVVFRNPELLKRLEDILHPAVYEEIENDYQRQQRLTQGPPLFVAEIPLLFETGGEKFYDYTVAVVANPELCLERFLKTVSRNKKEFGLRSARQLPQMEKAIRADYVLMNSGSLSDLEETSRELYDELLELTKL